MTRFSMKELNKNVKTETIIPDDYTELKSAQLTHEKEKAYLISFDKGEFWFAKQFVIIKNGKYYSANWLIKKHTELL